MNGIKDTLWWPWLKYAALLAAAIIIVAVVTFLTGPKVGAIVEGLTPPALRSVDVEPDPKALNQNWPKEVSQRFHSISQGTRTLPLPLSWFRALEQPKRNLLALPFSESDLFIENDYLLRFGFIKGEESAYNPFGLPVGFAVTPSQKLPGVSGQHDAVGLTCAACHTGQITYGDQLYLIDGGPAVTDLGLLTEALGAALGQTALAARIPFFDGRFERFAERVLGDSHSDGRRLKLQAELESLLGHLASVPSGFDVVEGFSRLDALNRIGNQVFAIDNKRHDNYAAINAPVNFPHIWTVSWFDWVQYDGSIMGPLIRNAGEALGVSAFLNTTAPLKEHRFASSIDYNNLRWIEDALSGPPPYPEKTFKGLLAPSWPDGFPEIDERLADRGRTLYDKHCSSCHRPPLDSEEIWQHFYTIAYEQKGEQRQSPDRVLRVKAIPLSQVGTDPAQANVLLTRTVNTAGDVVGTGNGPVSGMGLNTRICVEIPTQDERPKVGYPETESPVGYDVDEARPLIELTIDDSTTQSFAYGLGALVQMANDSWFLQNNVPKDRRAEYERERPNCLRAGAGYKARPLNGVWATAPFLHNGSVPTLHALLSPPEDRPDLVQLGGTAFDPVRVGIAQDEAIIEKARSRRGERYVDGYFILNTQIAGNLNIGHEFSDRWQDGVHYMNQPKGVIGPLLSEEERLALIEFLKTQ